MLKNVEHFCMNNSNTLFNNPGDLYDGRNRKIFSNKNVFFFKTFRRSQMRCSVKKGILKKFTNFTGKHLCWSLF